MPFLHNVLSGCVYALALTILALLCIPELASGLDIDVGDRLPIAAGLLALCALLKPYVATRALMALIKRHAKRSS